jgi:hypothetical protein
MKRDHIHKLKRVVLGKNKKEGYEVYKCIQGCTTYYPLAMVEGMISQCHACLEPFMFTKPNFRQVKPKCKDCTGRPEVKDEKVVVASDAILKNLGLK